MPRDKDIHDRDECKLPAAMPSIAPLPPHPEVIYQLIYFSKWLTPMLASLVKRHYLELSGPSLKQVTEHLMLPPILLQVVLSEARGSTQFIDGAPHIIWGPICGCGSILRGKV
ncbi:hypothetical protein GDO81_003386 [Engystomops pustulosus]|uniref:Uncharacterized protein n=1 Tax=Engystomops pustulosus TaxID=76066 RepID=A0AAV6ZVL4_ENGPU|nr:hypothetical protein GDO81_003386 [Engystomops pustulosus]